MDDRCFIDRLPDELLIIIFAKCDSFLQVSLAQVCRRWKYLYKTESLWKKVTLVYDEYNGRYNGKRAAVLLAK